MSQTFFHLSSPQHSSVRLSLPSLRPSPYPMYDFCPHTRPPFLMCDLSSPLYDPLLSARLLSPYTTPLSNVCTTSTSLFLLWDSPFLLFDPLSFPSIQILFSVVYSLSLLPFSTWGEAGNDCRYPANIRTSFQKFSHRLKILTTWYRIVLVTCETLTA